MSQPRRYRYSKVSRRIWRDKKVRRLTPPQPCGRFLWIWLLTCDEQNIVPGLIALGEAALAEAIEWPLKGFREAFREASREGMAKADWEARLVWIPKRIEHDEPASPNVILSWSAAWDELPECDLKIEAYQALRTWCKGRGKAWLEAFDKACPKPSWKPSGNQEQEQDQDQDQDLDPPCTPLAAWDDHPSNGGRPAGAERHQIAAIWNHFLEKRSASIGNQNPPKLTSKTKTQIRARLRTFRPEQLCAAIEVLFGEGSFWVEHKFTTPAYAFRSDDQVEKLLARLEPKNDYEREEHELQLELEERARASRERDAQRAAGGAP